MVNRMKNSNQDDVTTGTPSHKEVKLNKAKKDFQSKTRSKVTSNRKEHKGLKKSREKKEERPEKC